MAFTLASIQKGQIIEPPRILIHGAEGIGKTSFASQAPKPIFIFTEKGRGSLAIDSFPLVKSWRDMQDALRSLRSEDHDYETVVIDSVDWLERILFTEVCEAEGKNSIEDFGFGKGYAKTAPYWNEFLGALDDLHEDRRMIVILIGHSVVKTFNNPEGDNYDQFILAMHKEAASTLKEWADTVLFANYDVKVRRIEGAIQKDKGKAVKPHTDPPRLLFTEERPAYWAKNRYNLPHVLPLSWQAFADAMDAGIAKTQAVVEKLNAKAQASA